LVGVGVAAGPLEQGPQAIVSQMRINTSRLARMTFRQPRCALEKEVKTHPPQESSACTGIM